MSRVASGAVALRMCCSQILQDEQRAHRRQVGGRYYLGKMVLRNIRATVVIRMFAGALTTMILLVLLWSTNSYVCRCASGILKDSIQQVLPATWHRHWK
jgi:hypothetical protein